MLCVLLADVLWLYEPVAPLTEALESYWLVIHVVSAVIATGAFTLGGITSILYLLKARSTKETGYLARLPELAALDRISYRMHAFGFPVWTFGVLISGPIWAHQAWSSYWNWDPKEVWAFITWVVYAAYLHARATAGWRGRNAAILALVGVATLWFNFIGINFFSTTSQHSYAEGVGEERSVVLRLAGPVEAAEEVGVVVGADRPRGVTHRLRRGAAASASRAPTRGTRSRRRRARPSAFLQCSRGRPRLVAVKEFVVYTVLRIVLFLASFGVIVGIMALVFDGRYNLFWAVVLAFLVSGIASYFILDRQREAFAQRVETRAAKAAAAFEERKAREDAD